MDDDLKFDRERALVDAPYANLVATLRGQATVTAQDAFDLAVACLDSPSMSERQLLLEAAQMANPTIQIDFTSMSEGPWGSDESHNGVRVEDPNGRS